VARGSSGLPILGGLTAARFLRRHWQKRPLLVRGAIPRFEPPVTPGALLGLARRPDVESRLVLEKDGRRPWQVVPGPLHSRVLSRLPASHWTVLVHGVDVHVPDVADLVERFDFLPRWRVDDVMVSLAAPAGSVGPHVDRYDVFLLQGQGRRRWRIARHFDPEHRPGLDLRVLRRFRAEAEWILGPGDMLYLPPGMAHHGVALDEGTTFSIGFRAPSHALLLAGFLHRLVQQADRARLYEDGDLSPAREPGEISPAAVRRLRAIVVRGGRVDSEAFARFAGEHLTERGGEDSRRSRVDAAALARSLRAGAGLVRRPGARLAFMRSGRGALLFADGASWRLATGLAGAAGVLTRTRRIAATDLRPWIRRSDLTALVADLLARGVFRLDRSRPRAGSGRARPGNRAAAGSRSRARPR